MKSNYIQVWHSGKLIWGALDATNRLRLTLTFMVSSVAVFFEFLGLGVIIPFLRIVTEPQLIKSNEWLVKFFEFFPWMQGQEIAYLGTSCIAFVVLSSVMGFLGHYLLARLAAEVSAQVADVVFSSILRRDYAYHLRHSTNVLMSKISHVNSIGNGFINPFFQIVSRLLILSCILVTLAYINPVTTIVSVLGLATIYGLIYLAVSGRVRLYGQRYLDHTVRRQRTMNEAFRGIKDVIVNASHAAYVEDFKHGSIEIWRNLTRKNVLGSFPKFFLEGIAFGGVLALTIVLVGSGGDVRSALTEIGFFAVLGYRILPSVQQIYANMITIVGTLPSIREISDELTGTVSRKPNRVGCISLKKSINLCDVSFAFEDSKSILSSVSFDISRGQSLAVVGPSGAGKSTFIDLLLGLLRPSHGQIKIDGQSLDEIDGEEWRAGLAYVPQSIFILEGDVVRNLTFGIDKPLDADRMRSALSLSCADSFLSDSRAFTEAGKNLSGGQRQRIGIARALYKDVDLLILDEATSALDPETERNVWGNLVRTGKTIVLVTHRMALAKKCDKVLFLVNGRVEALGHYDDLITRSSLFQKFVTEEEKKET